MTACQHMMCTNEATIEIIRRETGSDEHYITHLCSAHDLLEIYRGLFVSILWRHVSDERLVTP